MSEDTDYTERLVWELEQVCDLLHNHLPKDVQSHREEIKAVVRKLIELL